MTGDELIRGQPELWRAAVRHPFLAGVRDGSLPEAAFRAWLVQDYLYLEDLLRFQAGLLRVAPRRAQAVLAAGLVALESELGWFEAQAGRWQALLDGERTPLTRRYRDFLEEQLAVGWEPAVTALWALERAYLEAWAAAAPGAPAYRRFVEHWTAPGFAEYVRGLQAAVGDGGDENAFRRTLELERDFWEMAWQAA